MANKYIDVSATYNGDGTTSDQATSAGGTGAWNNFVNVITGSPGYGSLAAGDVVYVRTYNGGNLSASSSSNITCVNTGTAVAPIKFIFDNGDVWATGGQFTIQLTGSSNGLYLGYFMELIGSEKGVNSTLKIYQSGYTATTTIIQFESSKIRNAYILGNQTGGTGTPAYIRFGSSLYGGVSELHNVLFVVGSLYSSVFTLQSRCQVKMSNVTLDFTRSPSPGATPFYLFSLPSTSIAYVDINGLEIIGDTTNHNLVYINEGQSTPKAIINDLKTENGLAPLVNVNTSVSDYQILTPSLIVTGIDGESFDFVQLNPAYRIEWRKGNNYPYLNAVLPDGSNTPWSYKVLPIGGELGRPIPCLKISKFYNETAAIKKLTFNILSHDELTSPTKDQWWVDVSFTNDDRDNDFVSSYAINEALETSEAAWYPLSGDQVIYGADSYDRYQIEVTTPSAIKENSIIHVFMYTTVSFSDSSKFLFIDPEFEVSTP